MKLITFIMVVGFIACSQALNCTNERSKSLEMTKSGLIGAFIFQCEDDGSFKALQCHSSTGLCWCAARDGTVIKNRTRNIRDCECIRKNYEVTQKQLIGSYAPQCEEDGTFKSLQCHSSTGQCWCVSEAGLMISGLSSNLISCSCPLQKHQEKPLLGSFRVKCEEDGSYSALQTHERTSWCVSPEGKRVTPKYSGFLKSCDCLIQKQQEKPLLGSFRVRCEDDGTYSALQTHEKTSWCVSPEGKQVTEKRNGLLKSCNCLIQKHQEKPLLGNFRVRCESDGTYSGLQKHEMMSWCVLSNGQQITPKSQGVLTSCTCLIQKHIKDLQGFFGTLRPRCLTNGSYYPTQCVERYCWCVDEEGKKLLGDAKSEEVCQDLRSTGK